MTTTSTKKSAGETLFNSLSKKFDRTRFQKLHQTMKFQAYLDMVIENPLLALSAYQRIYDMILSKGVERFRRYGRTYTRYKFFRNHPQFPVFGLERYLGELVENFKGAAGYFGTEKRILLLHGPVGSSKSTIARAIKRGLEDFTASDRGALYTFDWVNIPTGPDGLDLRDRAPCPMHDDPLKLVPREMRQEVEDKLNARLNEMTLSEDPEVDADLHRIFKIRLEGEPNPHDNFFMEELMQRYKGDWGKVLDDHILVRRVVLSEARRVGIGTFQPKDEKNQDATELTGDVNYMKLGQYGRDSDPRAFNFDGEFMVANRGILEMIEMLKLNQEFLYDLLGAAQERQVKPKKFPQVGIDLVILGHTNGPEFRKLEKNECMEALRDRTVRVDIPYLLRHSDELEVLRHDYNKDKVRQHIAPHTLEIAALFAIISRLTVDKNSGLDPVKKAKLYDGKQLPGFTEEAVKELMDANPEEGLERGISARFVQNKISNALVSHYEYVNPFMVLHQIKEGLKTYPVIGDDEQIRAFYERCVDYAKKELEEILKNEVQRALVMDEDAIHRMFTNYLDNVFAYINDEKVRNEYTGEFEEPNERLMRSIEEKIDIPESRVTDFRRSIAAYVGHITRNEGDKALTWNKNPELGKALELKLFEEVKDSIKLSSLTKVTGVIDPDMQKKIDEIKHRLVEHYGYNEQSATDVLQYVGSIFARGEVVESE